MTREEILKDYNVDSWGIIQDPGKFESEPLYAPYFYDLSMDGGAETLDWPDETTTYVVTVDDSDREEFPEIGADIVAVIVEESDQGFITVSSLTQAELNELEDDNKEAWEASHAEEDADEEEEEGEDDESESD